MERPDDKTPPREETPDEEDLTRSTADPAVQVEAPGLGAATTVPTHIYGLRRRAQRNYTKSERTSRCVMFYRTRRNWR
jgi:hypothetical protein